jgi:hypothetical protein
MRVEAVSLDTEAAWEKYVAGHPQGTIYHTLRWRCVLEEGFGYRSHHLLARTADGTVEGVAALFVVRGFAERRLVAVPFRDRGGPIWSTPQAGVALFEAIRLLADRIHAGGLVIKTLVPYASDIVEAAGLREQYHWVHSDVDLAGRTWEQYAAALNRKVRHSIREATANDMAGDDVTEKPGAIDRWYALHLVTQRRLGIPAFPKRFFEAVKRHMAPAARVLVVRHRDADVAASLLLRDRDVVMYAYAASARQAGSPAGDLLVSCAIQWAIADGARRFDMGSDSPSQSGLLFFKRKWLARQAAIPTYVGGAATLGGQDSSSRGYDIARTILRGFPPPLYPLTSLAARLFG